MEVNNETHPRIVPEDHALIGQAQHIPVDKPTPVFSVGPVVLPAPGRLFDLQLKVSAPTVGHDLPIILLSHGHGRSNNLSSLNGYGPLVNFWAAHGFVVIQPTHLSSKSLSLDPETPGAPLFLGSRAEDMKMILDQLDAIEAAVLPIRGRLDKSKIGIAGHSAGGHTASLLLGMRFTDPDDHSIIDRSDLRIKAGVLLTAPGDGGSSLSAFASEHYPIFKHPDFTKMKTPALVVMGDSDSNLHLNTRGAEWHADPYHLSSGPKSLLNLVGGTHCLGRISGYDAAECSDESPERVAVVQRLTWAYLRSALYPEDPAWSCACAALEGLGTLGRVESK